MFVGGAHLARYILDNPETVRDKRVKDIGSGSGIVAVAAFFAGAREVTAIDNDEVANIFIKKNLENNNIEASVLQEDALRVSYEDVDVITATDVFLQQALQFQHLLKTQAQNGKTVFAASGHFSAPALAGSGFPLKPTVTAQRLYGTPSFFVRLG